MRKRHAVTIIALTAITLAAAGDVDARIWNAAAPGCVIGPGSAAAVITAGTVKFDTSATGDITLFCSVSDAEASGDALFATYYDSTSTTSSYVEVLLRSVDKSDASIATIADFNSDDDGDDGAWYQDYQGFTHTFDHNGYYYFLQITLHRTSTSELAQIKGASIETAP